MVGMRSKKPDSKNNPHDEPSHRGKWLRPLTLGFVAVLGTAMLGTILMYERLAPNEAEASVSRLRLEDIPFDGRQAYDYLKKLCEIGPRPSGSKGMEAQQKLLVEHFTKLGGKVELQRFRGRNPVDGSWVPMANLIVRWHSESKDRILLCAHYDTLPYPMLDPRNPRGVFVGANDGASGVAVLMQLGHSMAKLKPKFGVDFVLFDAEEFIFEENHPFFLGSEYFAQDYVANPPGHRYRAAVLLDMVADADLQLFLEGNSWAWRDSRPLVEEIWGTAARLGVREFIARRKHEIRDDHLALHNIAGIPACDIIDFDYPAWHTQADTPDRCSPLSLAKVGWVVEQWLSTTTLARVPARR